ncbi:MAG: adenosylcobinamide-GDP ribazoletransferase [Elainellaceae cyanobacterium]
MTRLDVGRLRNGLKQYCGGFAAAILFYTRLPVPSRWCFNFDQVARFAVCVGLLIGAVLSAADVGLMQIGVPALTRSAVLTLAWVNITGGLHLDGVMDTADGLAVLDPQRRLSVMADSRVGAFGAIAGCAVLLLKVAALSDIGRYRSGLLIVAAGWGRWGQQLAIARYPYLKAQGKGAMHKQALPSVTATLPSLALLLCVHLLLLGRENWRLGLGSAVLFGAIAWAVGAWLNRRFGGHTGDTYGAVVEWTEAIALVTFTAIAAVA